jgi:hypothetical protein
MTEPMDFPRYQTQQESQGVDLFLMDMMFHELETYEQALRSQPQLRREVIARLMCELLDVAQWPDGNAERIERAQYLEQRLTAIMETGPFFECECQEQARARAAQEPGT